MDPKVVLVGIAGHVKGEEFPLEYGRKVTIGRSRSADWSLVRLPSWTSKTAKEQEEDHAFRTISGKHFEITMFNLGSVEIANLSSNGTKLDGKTIDRATVTDAATKAHEIAFGADEILRLEARNAPAAAGAEAEAKPAEDKAAEDTPAEDKPAGDKPAEPPQQGAGGS